MAIGTRPVISFAVAKATRSLSQPSASDVTAVKRIFKCGTIDYGISNTKFTLKVSVIQIMLDVKSSTGGWVQFDV